ncbi:MAG: hypothetical protein SFZ03_07320 [Candidatus Melainabacteria bacterium]|nr:hypothetical protein [Candidatus Melainabacteria bacterium]
MPATNKKKLTPSRKKPWLLFVLMGLIVIALAWMYVNRPNRYYTKGWADKSALEAERKERIKRIQEKTSAQEKETPPSRQPVPPGFSEKDIKKYRGKGYDTF